MKKAKFFIVLGLICLLACGIGIGQNTKNLKIFISNFLSIKNSKKNLANLNIAIPVPKQQLIKKHFVVVIPSYNNVGVCKKNLASVLDQEYEDFRVIYIDDCSTDDSYEEVKAFINEHPRGHKVKLKRNDNNLGAMANFYNAIHSCENDEIIVVVDGDDWLAHSHVLSTLCNYYSNPDVWMTWGNYLEYPEYKEGFSKPIDTKILTNGSIRRKAWISSHLRTFYAGLFKQIQLKDLIYNGEFYQFAADVAMMLPMIEMASKHAFYIPEVLYIYNHLNPLCDDKRSRPLQDFVDKHIRSLEPYDPIKEHPAHVGKKELEAADGKKTDIIAFSYDRPLQLHAFLESLYANARNFDKVFVLYRSSNASFQKGFDDVRKAFPKVSFFRQSNPIAREQFKPMVLNCLCNPKLTDSDYVTFAVDDIIIKDKIDFSDAIVKKEKYGAYGTYLRLGEHIDHCYMLKRDQVMPRFLPIQDNVLVWTFYLGSDDWDYPNTVDLTLYKKSDILKDLEDIPFTFPNDMEELWANKADHKLIGICYKKSKMINIPLNIVSGYKYKNRSAESFSPKDLLEIYRAGKKMDIAQVYQIDNHSAHMDIHPNFVIR